jgi:hypothetical protein
VRSVTVEGDRDFQSYLATNPNGLAMLPEVWRESPEPVLKSDAGDFAKWLKINAPSIHVEMRKTDKRLLLRWLARRDSYRMAIIETPAFIDSSPCARYARTLGAPRIARFANAPAGGWRFVFEASLRIRGRLLSALRTSDCFATELETANSLYKNNTD